MRTNIYEHPVRHTLKILLYVACFTALVAGFVGAPLLAYAVTQSIGWSVTAGIFWFMFATTSGIIWMETA